jgi:predicted DNA-binding protein
MKDKYITIAMFPVGLYNRIRIYAAKTNKTIRSIFIEAIEKYMEGK